MKVGITYDLRDHYLELGYTREETAEFDSAETIESLEAAIRANGCDVQRIGNVQDLAARLVRGDRWDLAFNIAEGLYGRSREAQVPALLEAYNVPYTFSDPLTLALCLDKAMAKRIVKAAGVPTPAFWLIEDAANMNEHDFGFALETFPLFLKPNNEGTGKGVSPSSVISEAKDIRAVARKLISDYGQPVLVEQYLHGREFTVGVLGTGDAARVAGVLEVKLLKNAEPNVYSYMNKELCEERVKYTAIREKAVVKEASAIALAAYRALGCRDAGRVDLRADRSGKLKFLELNPIAGMHPTHSDLPIMCSQEGMSYNALVGAILSSASTRITAKKSARRAAGGIA